MCFSLDLILISIFFVNFQAYIAINFLCNALVSEKISTPVKTFINVNQDFIFVLSCRQTFFAEYF